MYAVLHVVLQCNVALWLDRGVACNVALWLDRGVEYGWIGVFVTAQNPYLQATTAASGATSLSYAPMMSFAHDAATAFEFDAGLIGLTTLTGEKLLPPAQALDVGEQKAMVDCLREYIVAPPGMDTYIAMCLDTCRDVCIDISMGMSMDISICTCIDIRTRHLYRHVYRQYVQTSVQTCI